MLFTTAVVKVGLTLSVIKTGLSRSLAITEVLSEAIPQVQGCNKNLSSPKPFKPIPALKVQSSLVSGEILPDPPPILPDASQVPKRVNAAHSQRLPKCNTPSMYHKQKEW